MLAAGFLSGTVLNLVNHRLQIDELPWSDPVIWTSSLLLAWLAAAAIFGVVYRPARQGRKVAYLTVASFLFLALSLVLRLVLPSVHSPARPHSVTGQVLAPTGICASGTVSEPRHLGRGGGGA